MNSSWLLVNKPSGVTSFEALFPIKRALRTGKVGHTGTLDKFAQGLLVVLSGGALKLSGHLSRCDKHYEAEILFGEETDTLDTEGTVVKHAAPPSHEALSAALAQFKGTIKQTPPVFSAIHAGGQRASALARKGQTPFLEPRTITIYDIQLVTYNAPYARITVHCSSGTYIRALARDIAIAAGSCAYLTALVRNSAGPFKLQDAVTIESADVICNAQRPLNKSFFTLLGFAIIDIDNAEYVLHGKKLLTLLSGNETALNKHKYAALFCKDNFCALISFNDDAKEWRYAFVVNKL